MSLGTMPVAFGPAAGVERASVLVRVLWRSHDGHRRRPAAVARQCTRSPSAEAEAARELAILLARSGFRPPRRIRDLPADYVAGNGHGGWSLASVGIRH
jgi:hypothetical protein